MRIHSGRVSLLGFFLAALIVAQPVSAPAQTIEWIRQFGTAANDAAISVAVDGTGLYVGGQTGGTLLGQTNLGFTDAFVRKYDLLGNVVWTRQFGTGEDDSVGGLALAPTGVYVVGNTYRGTLPGQISAGDYDAFVRKYDGNGNELWTRQFGTAFGDGATGVVADNSGVFIVGVLNGREGGGDGFLRKYDPNGAELWTRRFGIVRPTISVAIDATGVYIAGTTREILPGQTSAGLDDAWVRKYDSNGNELWTRQFGTANFDVASAVAANSSGVYVVANSGLAPGAAGVVLFRKFDANGVEQWARQFGTSGDYFATGVAVDAVGVYVAGNSGLALSPQSQSDAFVRKYDASGNELWTRQFGSAGPHYATSVTVDASGVYACGRTFGTLPGQSSAGLSDAFVEKLSVSSPPPVVSDAGVVNNASFAPSPAPGSIAAVFGSNLNNGSTVLASSFGPDSRLVTTLGGASVTINGTLAPIFYSTPGQLGIQIPFEVAGQTSATILVAVGGQTSTPRTIFLDALAPGIFTANNQGTGAAAILHGDGVTPVTTQNPARPNEVVILFATGLGGLTPPLATGAPSVGNRTSATATVNIDGIPGQVQFAGAAPGFVGLNQINVRIPAGTRTGAAIPLVISIGGKQSNAVTIAVGP